MNQRSDKGHFSFSKDERITQKKVIEYLFNSAKKLRVYPFDIRFYKNIDSSEISFDQAVCRPVRGRGS